MASKAKFVREIFMLEFLVGWVREFKTPQKVSIGTVWNVSSTVLLRLLKILFLKSLDGYLSCSCLVFAIKYKTGGSPDQ